VQLSEDQLPNEGLVSKERVLTKHTQLSGPSPSPGSRWGSPHHGTGRDSVPCIGEADTPIR